MNEEALAHWGLSRQKQNLPICSFLIYDVYVQLYLVR